MHTKKVLILFILILAIGIFFMSTIREGHRWAGDFSMYVHHAKNIVEGKPFGETGYIYNPHYPQLGPKTYPPVFPLLLAPAYKVFHLDLRPMKMEIIAFFMLALTLLIIITSREISFPYQILLIGIVGLNPFFWDFKDYVLSDIPFLVFTYISLFLFHRTYAKGSRSKIRIIDSLWIGIFMYLSFGTKTIGFVLIPSVIILDLIKRRKLSLYVIMTIGIFSILMILQTLLIHGDSDYFDQFFPFRPIYILKNIVIYMSSLAQFFDTGYHSLLWLQYALFISIIIFSGFGYYSRLKSITIYEVFLPLYMAIVILWPTHQGFRFLIPVIPFVIFYFFIGYKRVVNYLSRRFGHISLNKCLRYPIVLWIAFIAFAYVCKYSTLDFTSISDGIHTNETKALFQYINEYTKQDDVFMCKNPRILNLYTGRKSSVYFNPVDKKDLWNYIREIGATHLIVETKGPSFLARFIQLYKDSLYLTYSNKDFQVYRVDSFSVAG